MQLKSFLEAIIGNIYILLGITLPPCFCCTGEYNYTIIKFYCVSTGEQCKQSLSKYLFSNPKCLLLCTYTETIGYSCSSPYLKKPSKHAHIYKLKQTSQRYCSVVINAMEIIIFRISFTLVSSST